MPTISMFYGILISMFYDDHAPLLSEQFFSQVFIANGTVTWPNEIDLAPDAMYEAIKAHGEWILV